VNPNRRFLYEVLNRGLDLEMISPGDVLAHVTPDVLAHHLPIALKAKLLQASLNAERMTPSLVVEVVGVEALVEHAPLPVLWACVRVCVARQLQSHADDGLGSSLGIMPAGPAGPAAPAPSTTTSNGSGLAGVPVAVADDLQSRPAKPSRPLSFRPTSTPPRVSTLSPRSQAVRRGPDVAPGSAPTGSPTGSFDAARSEESPDFEIVEETDVPTRQRPGRLVAEDDTRPGSKP